MTNSKSKPNSTVTLVKILLSLTLFSEGVTAEIRPQRIVSLSLASDEVLLELLPKCGLKDRLMAVSTTSDDPESSNVVAQAKSIKNRVHSEPEALLSLKPDLVIAASFNRAALLDVVRKRGIRLLVLDQFRSHKDISENILKIGKAVDCANEASELSTQFLKRIAAIKEQTQKLPPQSAILYSASLSTMAGETLFDDLLTLNQLENVATKAGLKHWPTISLEALKTWNPYWIVLSCKDEECPKAVSQLKVSAAWKNLPATLAGRFLYVPPPVMLATSQYFGMMIRRPAP